MAWRWTQIEIIYRKHIKKPSPKIILERKELERIVVNPPMEHFITFLAFVLSVGECSALQLPTQI